MCLWPIYSAVTGFLLSSDLRRQMSLLTVFVVGKSFTRQSCPRTGQIIGVENFCDLL